MSIILFQRFKDNEVRQELNIPMGIIDDCLRKWYEHHRYYHDITHLKSLIKSIDVIKDKVMRDELDLVAIFHDVIYDPHSTINEEESAKYFIKHVDESKRECEECIRIYDAIMDTEYNFPLKDPSSDMSMIFRGFDFDIMFRLPTHALISNGMKIMKEYQYVSYPSFVQARVDFITEAIKNTPSNAGVDNLIQYREALKTYRPKIGVYAGSFKPFHIGHLNILEQAERIFDKVIILAAKNPDKAEDTQWDDELRRSLPFHEIVFHEGLTTDYLKEVNEYADVTLVRGLRDGYDLRYEANLRRFMEEMGECNIAYFQSGLTYQHISSSDLRGLKLISPLNYKKYLSTKYDYYKG